MAGKPYVLGIDQGTSGSRALVVDDQGNLCGYAYRPLTRIYPQPGWVEQDPQVVTGSVREVVEEAMKHAGCDASEIAACGIACQRNTDFVWDADTGQPLSNAITWQDLRTVPLATQLDDWELASERRRRLGYFPGPYCSALHLGWRMQEEPILRQLAHSGRLRIGLSAAWLVSALGHPRAHQMDYSLVQALGLYDFRARRYWSPWLERLQIPLSALPTPVSTIHEFGDIEVNGGRVPVVAMIGDQQAALFGYGCRAPGQAECTHGTASFVDVFLGQQAPLQERINVYFAWVLEDQASYCLEADTAVTGAAIRWMREQAGLFQRDEEIGPLALSVPDSGGVVFVPAFTGLNVPHNDRSARGTILGLTLGTTRAHIVRAFLEAVGFQLREILDTIAQETGLRIGRLYVGGGVSASDEACQIQADLLGIPTIRAGLNETTSWAAALLAGLGAGWWQNLDHLPSLPQEETTFWPCLSQEQRDAGYARWQQAVARAAHWARPQPLEMWQ